MECRDRSCKKGKAAQEWQKEEKAEEAAWRHRKQQACQFPQPPHGRDSHRLIRFGTPAPLPGELLQAYAQMPLAGMTRGYVNRIVKGRSSPDAFLFACDRLGYCKSPTSFRTTTCQNFTTVFSRHSFAESVFVYPSSVGRLKCSFHYSIVFSLLSCFGVQNYKSFLIPARTCLFFIEFSTFFFSTSQRLLLRGVGSPNIRRVNFRRWTSL